MVSTVISLMNYFLDYIFAYTWLQHIYSSICELEGEHEGEILIPLLRIKRVKCEGNYNGKEVFTSSVPNAMYF